MSDERAGASSRPHPGQFEAAGTRTVEADALLAGAREIVIVHRGERYRLRITQNGKLILTK